MSGATEPWGTRRGLGEQLLAAYSAGWTVVLAVAAICALLPAARWLAHHELALRLHLRIGPAPRPTLAGAGWLLSHNLRATFFPLAAVLFGAQQSPWARRTVHVVVLASFAVNTLPVAAAIGIYRSHVVPYLPHLPFELYAITTGPATWLISTQRTITRRQLAGIAASMVAALVLAALLETWAVPHR